MKKLALFTLLLACALADRTSPCAAVVYAYRIVYGSVSS